MARPGPTGGKSLADLNSNFGTWRFREHSGTGIRPSSKRLLGQLPGRGWVRLPCTSAIQFCTQSQPDVLSSAQRAQGLSLLVGDRIPNKPLAATESKAPPGDPMPGHRVCCVRHGLEIDEGVERSIVDDRLVFGACSTEQHVALEKDSA